jgi:hypothetical protein
MVGSQFISDAELDRYIDMSHAELYDILVGTYEDYYTIGPVLVTVAGTNIIPVPNDLYKLIAIDLAVSNQPDGWIPLRQFMMQERYKRSNLLRSSVMGLINVQYRLVGSQIILLPENQPNGTYRLFYVPKRTPCFTIAGQPDNQATGTIDGIQGWQQYVIIDAAIKCLRKEESDVNFLLAEKAALKERIEDIAVNRDAGSAQRVQDVSRSELGFNIPSMW